MTSQALGQDIESTCPFCGSYPLRVYGYNPEFKCGTERWRRNPKRGPKCYEKEIVILKKRLAFIAKIATAKELATYRCFHCGQAFIDPAEAEEHFGKRDEREHPVCKG